MVSAFGAARHGRADERQQRPTARRGGRRSTASGSATGWRDALSLVIMTSVLGNMIASHNAVVRIQYGMGRAKALPSAFGRTGARQTPYFAICVQIAVSVIVTLVMGVRLEHDEGVRLPRLHQRAGGRRRVHPGPAGGDGLLPQGRAGEGDRAEPRDPGGRHRDPRCRRSTRPSIPNPGAPLKWSPYVILGWTLLGGIYLLVRDASRPTA